MFSMSFFLILGNFIFTASIFIYLLVKIKNLENNEEYFKKINKEVASIVTEINQSTERSVLLFEDKLNTLNTSMSNSKKIIDLLDEKNNFLQKNIDKLNDLKKENLSDNPKNKTEKIKDYNLLNLVDKETSYSVEIKKQPELRKRKVLKGKQENKKIETTNTEPKKEKLFASVKKEIKPVIHKKEQAISLYRQGISNEIIAKKLNMTLSEIELITSLLGG